MTTVTIPTDDKITGRLRVFFWSVAVALGALDAWAGRYAMNPDGISYLDMGDAYLRGDWNMAINAYWSPLYSWFLGLFLKVSRPSARWEFPAVHIVNFLIYLVALASFEFFLCALISYRRNPRNITGQTLNAGLAEWVWRILGYSVFIWTSLVLINLRIVTPDMCVAAFVYLASGLLLRVRSGTPSWLTFVIFGVVLGLGYLAKAVIFPLAFVFLAIATFSSRRTWKVEPRVLVSALTFLAVASPLIVELSLRKNRLTFGDTARVNYEIDVDGVDWCIPSGNTLTHPVKRIFESPPAYEFGGPIKGTYPLWYDTSYWHEGLKPFFDLNGQLRAIRGSLLAYRHLFFSPLMLLNVSAGLIILFAIARQHSTRLRSYSPIWPLLILALSGLGLYSLAHVEHRFIGSFVCLLWLGAFSAVPNPESANLKKLVALLVVVIAITTCLSAVWWMIRGDHEQGGSACWKASIALNEMHIRPGDKIAVVGNEAVGQGGAYVARLAKVQIIAQVKEPDRLWTADSSTQFQVEEGIAKTGVKCVLTSGKPPPSAVEGCWQRLGDTQYFARLLKD